MRTAYHYNGHLIDIWEDREDDNIKLFHDVFPPGAWTGKGEVTGRDCRACKMLDLSPYGTNDLTLCAAMIDLGFPTREDILPNGSIGPLHREDVETLWRAKFGDKPMPTMDDLTQL